MPLDLRSHAVSIIIWAVLLTMPIWMPLVGGYTELGTQVVIIGLAAMALNFLLGHTGVVSFGHAAYFGLGAYGAGMTIRYLEPSTPLSILVGVAVATLAAVLIGPLIVRRRGVYFAMATIAFGQVFYFIAVRWNTVTGGDDGLTNWHREDINFGFAKLALLHSPINFYYFSLALFAVAVGLMATVLHSPFGRTLIAIRENERRTKFMGINVNLHIWISWLISCSVIGLAGALYALQNNFVDPHSLFWTQSGIFVIICVLGGMRSFWGPLVGAAIYVVLQDYLSGITPYWQSLVGAFFIIVVLFFPRGVMGILHRRSAQ